jgi:anti-sigma factor RsiW
MICAGATALIPLYLSGELDEPRAREFAKHIQNCPECAREVSLQMAMDARLRAAVLAEPVDSRIIEARVLQNIAAGSKDRRRTWRGGLAAAAILVVGVSVGYTGYRGYRAIRPSQPSEEFAAAARDHHTEVVDGQPRKWRMDLVSVSDLALREGVSNAMIRAIAPAGYHFRQARLCKLHGTLYLHLVYADTTGDQNVSVFLDGQEPGRAEKIYAASVGAENVAGFQNGHIRAVIVTDQSGDAAVRFARFAASVI